MARGRQPNGSSSIYLGKDGWYHCYVPTGRLKPNGRPERKHIRRKTATAVAEARDEVLQRIARGATPTAKIETVEQWLTHWLANVVKPNKAWASWKSYESLIRIHAIPGLGRWRLDGRNRLEPEHIEAFYAGLSAAGKAGKPRLGAGSRLKLHRVLSKAFKDAVRRHKAPRNPFDLVDSPSGDRTRVRAHTLDEAQAIIKAAAADEWAPRWLIGILLGPRQGEVLGLHWGGDDEVSHLELNANPPILRLVTKIQRRTWEHGCADPVACAQPHCRTKPCPPRYEHGCADHCGRSLAHHCPRRRQIPGCSSHRSAKGCPPLCKPGCAKHALHCPERVGGGLVESRVKSEKSIRDLVIPPVLVDALIAWREGQQRERASLGKRWDPLGLVFTTFEGDPVDPRRDWDAWQALLRAAGVRRSRVHAARHTAGTLMLATGTDIAVVQEILGHVDIRTTRGYVDIANDLKKAAVERVAAALFDGSLQGLLQQSGATVRPPR